MVCADICGGQALDCGFQGVSVLRAQEGIDNDDGFAYCDYCGVDAKRVAGDWLGQHGYSAIIQPVFAALTAEGLRHDAWLDRIMSLHSTGQLESTFVIDKTRQGPRTTAATTGNDRDEERGVGNPAPVNDGPAVVAAASRTPSAFISSETGDASADPAVGVMDPAASMSQTNADIRSEIGADMSQFLAGKPHATLSQWAAQSEWAADTGGVLDDAGSPVRCQGGVWQELWQNALDHMAKREPGRTEFMDEPDPASSQPDSRHQPPVTDTAYDYGDYGGVSLEDAIGGLSSDGSDDGGQLDDYHGNDDHGCAAAQISNGNLDGTGAEYPVAPRAAALHLEGSGPTIVGAATMSSAAWLASRQLDALRRGTSGGASARIAELRAMQRAPKEASPDISMAGIVVDDVDNVAAELSDAMQSTARQSSANLSPLSVFRAKRAAASKEHVAAVSPAQSRTQLVRSSSQDERQMAMAAKAAATAADGEAARLSEELRKTTAVLSVLARHKASRETETD
jgi:hypothetical protein